MTHPHSHAPPDQIWIVIPLYNEGSVIASVLTTVLPLYPKVVVVDDASTDDSAAQARASGVHLVSHPINLGQGAALQTGVDFALRHGASYIVMFDADGQHRASEIERLLAPLVDGKADFSLGSRFIGSAVNMPASRRLTLQAALLFTRITTRLRITDVHNGFRAMTRRGAEALQIRQNRMAHASEILEQIADSELRYVEVPVTVEYTAYSLQKGQKLTNSLSILVDLFTRRLHR